MVSLIETFQTFTGTLLICPKCGELLRLTDLSFRIAGKLDLTILDTLREKEMILQRQDALLRKQQDRFDTKWKVLREAAVNRGRAKAKRIVRKLDSGISKLRIDPNDIKAIAYPVDLVAFDGLSDGQKVKNIIFIARTNSRAFFKKIHDRIDLLISHGDVIWETVRIKTDGSIEVTNK